MRVERGCTQILFGHLPQQTVDINGRVWKVLDWVNPQRLDVDQETLRRALERQASAWERTSQDGDFVQNLRRGFDLEVVHVSTYSGVVVEPFPKVWVCKACQRIGSSPDGKCQCGKSSWGPFHFVGYHSCGKLVEPRPPRCPQHNQVRVRFPGTASAAEIEFCCPVCNILIRKGLGTQTCDCGGQGRIVFNVHRAGSVFSPKSVVVVNSPSPQRVKDLQAAGGPSRALDWVMNGMVTKTFRDAQRNRSSFVQDMIAGGLTEELASTMADIAVAKGEVLEDSVGGSVGLPARSSDEAESQAVTIAMATADSRIRMSDLRSGAAVGGSRRALYEKEYPKAIRSAGLHSVELIDSFPILTGVFGFTRDNPNPGASRLVTYRQPNKRYRVFADMSQTEALFVRLDPTKVAAWMDRQGLLSASWSDERTARIAILQSVGIPEPGDDPPSPATAGSVLLTLVHSFAHRFIRLASFHAGIERTSLAELLVPSHLGFFVYAATRGDFVLGGLQALFETALDNILDEVAFGESRCALDPGCTQSGCACAACLHLGEPSCRWFNRFLDRSTLRGPNGYLDLE